LLQDDDDVDKNQTQVDINHIIANIHQYSGSGVQKLVQNLKRRNIAENQNQRGDDDEQADDQWPSAEPASRLANAKNSTASMKHSTKQSTKHSKRQSMTQGGQRAQKDTVDATNLGQEFQLNYQYDKDSLWKYSWGLQNPRLTKLQEGGLGRPVGMTYAGLAHTGKKLAFGDEVSRTKRAKVADIFKD